MTIEVTKIVPKTCPVCKWQDVQCIAVSSSGRAFYECPGCSHVWSRSLRLKPEYREEEE